MLVEDESAAPEAGSQPSLRPISLVELQQAIEAAAPPLPEPASPPGWPSSPLRSSTPLPLAQLEPGEAGGAHDSGVELAAPPVRRERKRRHSVINLGEIVEGSIKFIFNAGQCLYIYKVTAYLYYTNII